MDKISPEFLAAAWELRPAQYYLRAFTLADLAQLEVLRSARIISDTTRAELRKSLLALDAGLASKTLSPKIGDIYKNRESQLKKTAPNTYGWLSTSRARREANTVAFNLTVRTEMNQLILELLETCQTLVTVSQQHTKTWMPDYTYLQKAQPSSYGHYLLSFVEPLLRDISRYKECYNRISLCPGGIGSTNGTGLKINRHQLAKILGFDGPVRHTRDAMWQHDLPIEIMSALVSTSSTIARLADDFQIWCTEEFDFLSLNEKFTRASVIMPQKRNPYVFSYLRGLASTMLGSFVSVTTCAHTTTGQNDNRIIPYHDVPLCIELTRTALRLLAKTIKSLVIKKNKMLVSVRSNATYSADLVEAIVQKFKIDHQTAYLIVKRSLERKSSQSQSIKEISQEVVGQPLVLTEVFLKKIQNPQHSAHSRRVYGGAAPESVKKMAQESSRLIQKEKLARKAICKKVSACESLLLNRSKRR